MTQFDAAHPLADALEKRGFTARPMFSRLFWLGCAGRDLLVSAQTGSGKTVAGLSVADQANEDADLTCRPDQRRW